MGRLGWKEMLQIPERAVPFWATVVGSLVLLQWWSAVIVEESSRVPSCVAVLPLPLLLLLG